MAMTKSRRATHAKAEVRHTPELYDIASPAEIESRTAAAEIEIRSHIEARMVDVAALGGLQALRIRADYLLEHAFQRIDALETEMTKAKRLQAKSLNSKFSLDDLQVEQIGDRRVRVMLARGGDEAAFDLTFPMLIGRGVWTPEGDYEAGDVCQWGGTAWEALDPVKGVKPDASNRGWRILAKRGRDAKDVK
jgi:hypothetical protein